MIHCLSPLNGLKEAEQCRSLLHVPRHWLRKVSKSTRQIMLEGGYSFGEQRIDLSKLMTEAVSKKVSIPPEMELPFPEFSTTSPQMTIQVRNETTLMSARRMVQEGRTPLVLNFANGTQVGGGFLTGSRAQEETLCYASTLYGTLVGDRFYRYNTEHCPTASTDYAILSRAIVFRNDKYEEIESPWTMDVLTSAAPIANPHWNGLPYEQSEALMDTRIARVLDIAIAYGYTDLVLGAWGCGAFGNDPNAISALFEKHLHHRQSHFHLVYFTIADWSPERRFLGPFADRFSPQ